RRRTAGTVGGRRAAAAAVPECDLRGQRRLLGARTRPASARPRQLHPGAARPAGRQRPARDRGRRALPGARQGGALPLQRRAHAGPDARRDRGPGTRRRRVARRRGVLRRPDPRPAMGARADHHGLRPQRRAADRREARVPRRQAGTRRPPVLHPRPGLCAGQGHPRRARPLRHCQRGRLAAGAGAACVTFAARLLLAMLVLAGVGLPASTVHADEVPDPGARPELDQPLRDPDFGVRTRETGLERVVEMYQWRPAANGYARGWSSEPVDSAGFAPEHENPAFPLHSQRWLPGRVTVDGVPLDEEVLATLGEWREFRPSFSALPGNLAATFQPEGDGLGSAENPLAPQVGDLHIQWRERVLPPLAERIELREGAWRLRAGAAEDAAGEPAGGGGMPG